MPKKRKTSRVERLQQQWRKLRTYSLFHLCLKIGAATVMLLLLLWILYPNFEVSRYAKVGSNQEKRFDLPLQNRISGTVVAHIPIQYKTLTPSTLDIRADDCLVSVVINGVKIDDNTFPFCDYKAYKTLYTDDLLKTGNNMVTIQYRNMHSTGGINVKTNHSDPLYCSIYILFVASVFYFVLDFLRRKWKYIRKEQLLFSQYYTEKTLKHLAVFILIVISYATVYSYVTPVMLDGTHQFDGNSEARGFQYPLQFWSGKKDLTVIQPFYVNRFHAKNYNFQTDDCLKEIHLNGKKIYHHSLPYCKYWEDIMISLKPHLVIGENVLEIKMGNKEKEGGFLLSASNADPLLFFIHCTFIFLLLASLRSILLTLKIQKEYWTAIFIGFLGTSLRLIYVLNTHYNTRQYDGHGHRDYIMYVINNFSFPSYNASWQAYQPPLYYFLNLVTGFPAKVLGYKSETIYILAEYQSFFYSVVTLCLGIWIAHLVFPKKDERKDMALFAALIAVLPTYIFTATRISNDVLMHLLSFVFFGLLLLWWHKPSEKLWYAICFCISLNILTKGTGLLFIPIAGFCLLTRSKLSTKQIVKYIAIGSLIIATCSGWYYAYRFGVEEQPHLVGNLQNNQKSLFIEFEPKNLFIFRPHAVLDRPYNTTTNNWSGRQFFWEFFLKSTIVGEWNLGYSERNFTRIILVLYMIFTPFFLLGMFKDIFSKKLGLVPMWSTFIFIIAGMMLLVARVPIAGFQHFRYFPILALPGMYYTLKGIQHLPSKGQSILYHLLYLLLSSFIGLLYVILFI